MFNSKSKSSAEEATGSTSIIGAGTTITGNIETTGDIRIDGILIGNLTGKAKIFIGAEGMIEGDVQGQQADILGKVAGKIRVTDLLNLREKAMVEGNIYAGKLQVEPTVTFNGQCFMGGSNFANIVELNVERANAVNE